MAINRYTNRQPVNVDFYKTPLQPFIQALAMKQENFDKAAAAWDELNMVSINSLDDHDEAAAKIVQGYRDNLGGLVEKYDGDYSKMGRDLAKTATQIKRDFLPGGEAFEIESRLKEFQTWRETEQKKVESGVINPYQLDLATSFVVSNIDSDYKKQLKTPSISSYVDISESVDGALKTMESEIQALGGQLQMNADGSAFILREGTKEHWSKERVQQVVLGTMSSNDPWNAYAEQMATFQGKDVTKYKTEILNEQLDRAIAAKAVTKVDMKTNFKINPVWADGMSAMNAENMGRTQSYGADHDRLHPGKDEYLHTSDLLNNYDLGWIGMPDVSFGKRRRTVAEAFSDPAFLDTVPSLAVETYEALKDAYGDEWNNMNEHEKADLVTSRYNENMTTLTTRADLRRNLGPAGIKYNNAKMFDGGELVNRTFDVYSANGKKTNESPLNWTQMKDKLGLDSAITPAQFQEEYGASAGAQVTAGNGTRNALTINVPGKDIVLYAFGLDAQEDNLQAPVLELSRAMDPNVKITDAVEIPGMDDMLVFAMGRNLQAENPNKDKERAGIATGRMVDLYYIPRDNPNADPKRAMVPFYRPDGTVGQRPLMLEDVDEHTFNFNRNANIMHSSSAGKYTHLEGK